MGAKLWSIGVTPCSMEVSVSTSSLPAAAGLFCMPEAVPDDTCAVSISAASVHDCAAILEEKMLRKTSQWHALLIEAHAAAQCRRGHSSAVQVFNRRPPAGSVHP